MVLLQVLDLNDINFVYTQDEMYDTIVSIASGTCTYEELLEFVKARLIDYGIAIKKIQFFFFYD